MIPLKLKKSAGVRVTPRVHRLVARGDAARDAGRWLDAAAAYRRALNAAPELYHLRIQLGHALKQAGQADAADEAYAEAARLRPEDAEPVLHRAHLAKQRQRSRAAARLFIAALERAGEHGEAETELCRLIEPVADIPPDILLEVLREPGFGDREQVAEQGRSSGRPLLFDITDLVGHFRYQRFPTGIQRVQLEVLDAALSSCGKARVALCCFVSGRDGWIGIPLSRFVEVAALARGGEAGDRAWQVARGRLFVGLALDDRLAIPPQAILVNLGTSLWVTDYFRFIRNAKSEHGISYIPFVHDLIPVLLPEYCVRGITEEFVGWLAGVFPHADGFLVNSRSTARDLSAVALRLGHGVPDSRIEVVPLDGDFRSNTGAPGTPLPLSALAAWGLAAGNYALLVSTIEPRKNHALAFDAWAELVRLHGADAVPQLVCVGRDGWMNDAIFARLAADPVLIAAVTLIHAVSDAELALLYRGSRFTVYPSHYEGWGLPVTESLCYGRVPLVADNSSLPEAGAGLALMFESGSVSALVRAVEQVAFDHAWRSAREAQIGAEFEPRPWSAVAAQIAEATARLATDAAPAALPEAKTGPYYPLALHREPVLWPGLSNGEVFRFGEGWRWIDARGCRTAPEGGELRMRVAARPQPAGDEPAGTPGPLRLYLRLRGLDSADCPVAIIAGGQTTTATVRAGQTLWIACAAPDGPDLSIIVRGAVSETVPLHAAGGAKIRSASVTVLGFLLAEQADEAAARRATFKIDSWRGKAEHIDTPAPEEEAADGDRAQRGREL